TYHATGWKVGYAVAPRALTEELRKVHQYLAFCAVTPLQHALADFMRERPEHYLSLPEFYREKRDLFVELLAGSRFEIEPTQGTYFQLADYRRISSEPDTEFARRLTAEHGVAAIPISVFCAEPPPGATLVRFCFANQEQTLRAAAARLWNVESHAGCGIRRSRALDAPCRRSVRHGGARADHHESVGVRGERLRRVARLARGLAARSGRVRHHVARGALRADAGGPGAPFRPRQVRRGSGARAGADRHRLSAVRRSRGGPPPRRAAAARGARGGARHARRVPRADDRAFRAAAVRHREDVVPRDRGRLRALPGRYPHQRRAARRALRELSFRVVSARS